MAKHTITHTCGHEVVHNLIGKSSYRQWQKEKLTNEPCWECQKAARAEIAAARTAAAGLVELGGTEKQVAWANGIRLEKLKEIEEEAERLKAKSPDTDAGQHNNAKLDAVVTAIRNKEAAKWWIDNRDNLARLILVEEVRKAKVEFER